METMICITCPLGCRLSIERSEASIIVTGNKCPRGEAYAREELLSPRRVVTTTCRVARPATLASQATWAPSRIPVKTAKPFPKEKIPELLSALEKVTVSLPAKTGQVLLANPLGLGIDVVVTRTM